jgi:hypothetical protein
MILLFLLLLIVPFFCHWWANRYKQKKLWTVTLASFGVIVSPLAYGIYGIGGVIAGSIPYIGLYLGLAFIGIAGLIFFSHSPVGYQITIATGIQESAVVVAGLGRLWIEIINGIVWGTVYGAIGMLIDKFRNRHAKPRDYTETE